MFIDGDTHIDECEATWEHAEPALRPTTISFEDDEIPPWLVPRPGASSQHRRFWFIDSRLYSRRIRDDAVTGTTAGTRELRDLPGRMADMDKLDVSLQVIYPTLFLMEPTDSPELEVALCRSYNRWLEERCAATDGRLRFVAMVPTGAMDAAIEEARWAKQAGACGIFKRGVEWGRPISDPYFFPLYEEAARLDLPICIHSSLPFGPIDPTFARRRPVFTLGFTHLTVLQAFHALLADKVPQRFPGLRFAFVEGGSAWLPHLCDMLDVEERSTFLQRNNLFVTCEAREDLAYLVGNFGDEAFFIGTDYSHGDRSSVMNAHQQIVEYPAMSERTAERITCGNAAAFYGFAS